MLTRRQLLALLPAAALPLHAQVKIFPGKQKPKPAAPAVAWVAMARRKKAESSSMRSSKCRSDQFSLTMAIETRSR